MMGIGNREILMISYTLSKWKEKTWMWLAWKLPSTLVKWASIRLMAHATTGKYSETIVPELSAMDALGRWGK